MDLLNLSIMATLRREGKVIVVEREPLLEVPLFTSNTLYFHFHVHQIVMFSPEVLFITSCRMSKFSSKPESFGTHTKRKTESRGTIHRIIKNDKTIIPLSQPT